LAVAALAAGGCATPPGCDRGCVSRSVEARFGHGVGPPAHPNDVIVPEGLADGRPLAEDEVVWLALWNNALFREALVEVDLTRADLVQAGLLPNPEFVYSWPAQNSRSSTSSTSRSKPSGSARCG
jgi:cobalt-zinc-cadmium efflux system outer membrane protein